MPKNTELETQIAHLGERVDQLSGLVERLTDLVAIAETDEARRARQRDGWRERKQRQRDRAKVDAPTDTVECPRCKAKPGEPCHSRGGDVKVALHARRVAAATA